MTNPFRLHPLVHTVTLIALLAAGPVHAALEDDFEDLDLVGWNEGNTGCCGSTGVSFRNGSQQAYVYRHYESTGWLSQDVTYRATDWLSFDMQALVIGPGGAGVQISFLDKFNGTLGRLGFYNVPDPLTLGAHEHWVDGAQHAYAFTMAEAAAGAGLAPDSPVTKVSLRFQSWATGRYGEQYNSTVYFDDVFARPVPEPSSVVLMAAGLGLVGLRQYRRRPA